MAKAQVVIGGNFGDEGKGLMTDYLARKTPSLNVLFNGGAQRGHTVQLSGGFRHVFHHIGAGMLTGASTLLSYQFISNPIALRKELEHVKITNIYADALGRVTTPYDMALNQLAEEARNKNRHGSCGMGINETIVRHKMRPLYISDLTYVGLKDLLLEIKEEWVPYRLRELKITDIPDQWNRVLKSETLLDNFILDCKAFSETVKIVDSRDMLATTSLNVVFEAGQGLLLDEKSEYFPHVTHSRTGLDNILELTDRELEVFYMTRWYATRHGAGPFESELPEKPSPYIEDATNIPNDYQGTLRFGNLDLELLKKSIRKDMDRKGKRIQGNIVVTCLDQAKDTVSFVQGTVDSNDIIPYISYETGMNVSHVSNGPTRKTMLEV